MTIFIMVLAVLYVAHRARQWLREWYVPWYELRLREKAEGLPRGALAERWGHDGNGMADDTWIRVLRHVNRTTRLERKQLLRQR